MSKNAQKHVELSSNDLGFDLIDWAEKLAA